MKTVIISADGEWGRKVENLLAGHGVEAAFAGSCISGVTGVCHRVEPDVIVIDLECIQDDFQELVDVLNELCPLVEYLIVGCAESVLRSAGTLRNLFFDYLPRSIDEKTFVETLLAAGRRREDNSRRIKVLGNHS
ncbi:MAG: hypothetical protein C4523_09975 [Myxococcales bacterium]|nr:MAG: hypothetical protein C4523_09975 [Myxococcales bacterium]